MARDFIFTSESVSEGHPDKVADQISDAVLDAILAEDTEAHVACETFIKTGVAIVGDEITTSAWVDLEDLIRKVIVDIGYDSSEVGFDGHTCAVMNIIGKQSPNIDQGVRRSAPEDQGAGDQGLMFGYATNETDVLMPAPIHYAHELVKRQSVVRRTTDDGRHHLRPDAKSQVTFVYEDGKPKGIDAVVLSTQHHADVEPGSDGQGVLLRVDVWENGTERAHHDRRGHARRGGGLSWCSSATRPYARTVSRWRASWTRPTRSSATG